MTSVVGLDIGAGSSKIGLARNKGIDIILNESSSRLTPSLVAFGPRNRSAGESAKSQETSNFRNTIGNLKRLIGRSLSDPEIEQYEKKFIMADLVDVKGSIGVNVNYLGEQTTFSATQLYGMYLGALREIAAKEHGGNINDVVISVPTYYTDTQRRAVLDAAEIAGLNALRLINDTTSVALGYGITKTDLPEQDQPPRHVAFVDIGYSDFQCAITAMNKGKLVVKSTASDRNFGGRDFDLALTQHFAAEFKTKYKIDVLGNPKATFRLITAVEKLKKILSANAQAPLSVESIMNDIDANGSLSREDFEGLIAPLLERTVAPLQKALDDAGLTIADIDAVELVGGSTRIPALKNRISEFFGKPLSFTTNQDEAVARGATLSCAILSPIFRVRDFSITDINAYPIDICWEKNDVDAEDSIRVLEKGATIPANRTITLRRKGPFDLEARYAENADVPPGTNPWIAKYTVKNVTPTKDGDHATVKVKARLDLHGIFTFGSPYILEESEQDEDAPMEAADAPAEGAEGEATPAPAKKKKVVKKEVPGVFGSTGLDRSVVDDMREKEGQMFASDKLVAETEDRKNALEEYIYDARDKIDGQWSAFMPAGDKDGFRSLLTAAEDWLYSEEGEDATKSAYVAKLDELKKVGDPVQFRFRETEERPRALKVIRETVVDFMTKATSGDEKYAHLSEADLQSVIEKCANTQKWLDDMGAKQAERRKDETPAFTSTEIKKRCDDVQFHCRPILNKPKPKNADKPVEQPKAEPEAQKAPETNGDADMPESTEETKKDPEMDVD